MHRNARRNPKRKRIVAIGVRDGVSRFLSVVSALGASTLALACGARSSLDVLLGVATDASAITDASMPPGTPTEDRCPFAVQEGAPKPMAGSCSTRDGRARAPAPVSPHVTWTSSPISLYEGQGTAFSSDAAGYAYLTYWPSGDGVEWSTTKVAGTTGNVAWTTAVAPNGDSSPSTPFVTASGVVQTFAGMPPALLSFGATGLATSATLSATSGGLAFPTPDPAIGADGSLYLLTTPGAGVDGPASVVKIDPAGNPVWASPALPVSPPPATSVTVFALFDVALAPNGLVLVNLGLLLTPYANDTVIVALDPATGQPEWSNVYPGQQDGSLVVGADGTVITSLFAPADDGGTASVVLMLDASGHEKSRTGVPGVQSAWPLAVTTDGTVLVGTQFEGGMSGMVAISASGDILWNRSGLPFDGTNDGALSSDGVFVSYGTQVFAIGVSTGATKWSVDPPEGAGGVCNATLTTGATIVALGCNGVLFGVGD
jgi:hypothetical protein